MRKSLLVALGLGLVGCSLEGRSDNGSHSTAPASGSTAVDAVEALDARSAGAASATKEDLDFGSPPLGAQISNEMMPEAAAKAEPCILDQLCGYHADGVHLTIAANVLVRKCITLQRSTGRSLPFGLQYNDTPDTALQRLDRRFETRFAKRQLNWGTRVGTEAPLVNELNFEYALFLSFDRNRLVQICATQLESEFD
jgi:hypothetical protein